MPEKFPESHPVVRRLLKAQIDFHNNVLAADVEKSEEAIWMPWATSLRAEIEIAAQAGYENWAAWHAVSYWIRDFKDRFHCLDRALTLLDEEAVAGTFDGPEECSQEAMLSLMRTTLLCALGALHLEQGQFQRARECYERALPLARIARSYQYETPCPAPGLSHYEPIILEVLRELGWEEEGGTPPPPTRR